jgi:hypothetical protein
MEEIKQLREYIQNTLREAKKKQKESLRLERLQQYKLRKTLRSIIKESENIVTHESTGINVLADLLETIVPILKSFYKKLGTDVSQRKSFRAHTIKGVQNLLAPVALMFKAGGTIGAPETKGQVQPPETELVEQDEEVEQGPEADPAFIPTKEVEKEKEEAKPIQEISWKTFKTLNKIQIDKSIKILIDFHKHVTSPHILSLFHTFFLFLVRDLFAIIG